MLSCPFPLAMPSWLLAIPSWPRAMPSCPFAMPSWLLAIPSCPFAMPSWPRAMLSCPFAIPSWERAIPSCPFAMPSWPRAMLSCPLAIPSCPFPPGPACGINSSNARAFRELRVGFFGSFMASPYLCKNGLMPFDHQWQGRCGWRREGRGIDVFDGPLPAADQERARSFPPRPFAKVETMEIGDAVADRGDAVVPGRPGQELRLFELERLGRQALDPFLLGEPACERLAFHRPALRGVDGDEIRQLGADGIE